MSSLPEPSILYGGLSVVCKASETYWKLAVEYKVDGFVETSTSTEQVKKLIECLKGKALSKKEILVLKFLDGSDNRYIIPVYQRNYDWRPKQCEQLFNKLEDN